MGKSGELAARADPFGMVSRITNMGTQLMRATNENWRERDSAT
jgi:hypothetical protein